VANSEHGRLKFGEWFKIRERLKILELGNPKLFWSAYHARGMTAMLQLCYHKGASMAAQ